MVSSFRVQQQRINSTGVGFAGMDGLWWLPAREAFRLPRQFAKELAEIGRALFLLFDTVISLYSHRASAELNRLLDYKVPAHIPRLMGGGRVESVRPDFQLCPRPDGAAADGGLPESDLNYQPVITELEICPSAHGFAHAMQEGYGLETDLANSFARYLDGRELLFVGSSQWSEFLFEQLAFCRALAEVGARGRVLYDLPITEIADDVRQGRRWQVPLFGIREKPPDWNDDVIGRVRHHGFEPFLWPDGADWPEDVGQAVVFRFGYFDCFSPERLQFFCQWQDRGATLLNPAMFILDNKAMMAALSLPVVRDQIAAADPESLAVLDRSVPETILLGEENLARLIGEKDSWVVKYAGYDGGDQAWGGRSLQLGAAHTRASWRQLLRQYASLPWPVVAQRTVPSAQVDIAYVDRNGREGLMREGHTRLRSFILRDGRAHRSKGGAAVVCGSHLTVSNGAAGVSEGLDAVQAPIFFGE